MTRQNKPRRSKEMIKLESLNAKLTDGVILEAGVTRGTTMCAMYLLLSCILRANGFEAQTSF